MLWRTELPGPGASSPIAWGDRVFLTSYSGYGITAGSGEPTTLKRHALCVDRAGGQIRWNREVPAEVRDVAYQGPYITLHGYASSSPVTDGQTVYFFLALRAYSPTPSRASRSGTPTSAAAFTNGAPAPRRSCTRTC